MENLVKASISTKYVVSLMAPKGYLFMGQSEYDYNNIHETTMNPELSDSDFTELLISTGAIFKSFS